MQAPFDIAADLDTPVSAFKKLGPLRPSFLLESVEGGERIGRYSFIGFGEALEFELRAPPSTPRSPSEVDASRAATLETLRGFLERAPRFDPVGAPPVPFRGGLVGWTGYDVARLLERLPAARHPSGAPLAEYVAPSSVLVFDHLTRRVALLHSGNDRERLALRGEVVRLLAGPVPPRRASTAHAAMTPSLDRPAFLAAVARAREWIAQGDLFQLVLSVRFAGACDADPFEVYRALRLLNPSPYLYFLSFRGRSIIGSSPEALVTLSGRRASLRPIAGTRRRGVGAAEDAALERELLADPKETAEHVMLVDLARNDLGRVATPGSIVVQPFRSVERYSHVMHLVSGVNGILAPEHDAFDLFASAFPAGTVVGAPKVRAMERIDETEPVARGVYAGTVGYFGHGGVADQAIAIRTVVFENGECSFQAGAGIVADSEPESEFDEVLAKCSALAAALRLAEDGL